jgi:hypothetical protein
MAWVESYHCDVCGRAKNEDQDDWWLAMMETISPSDKAPDQPALRVTPWSLLLSHSADVHHLCGARCAQRFLDRWMTPIHDQQRAAEALSEDEDHAPGA